MNTRSLQLVVVGLLLVLPSISRAQELGESEENRQPAFSSQQAAQAVPAGYYLEDIAASASFDTPVGVTFASDGRIFVVEKRGRVYIVENGVKLATPFIDLEAEVLNHWDRGLLGFALDPDFDTNGFAYLLYTFDRDGSGDYERQDVGARLTRYTVDGSDSNVVDYSTRHVLIGETFPESIPSCYYSHTIGTLQFGSDGTLFVGAGDGADFGQIDPGGLHPDCFQAGLYPVIEDVGAFRSQYLGSLAGKILRIDPATGQGLPSNPFYTDNPDDTQSKVWALGVRNPYRYTLRKNGSTNPTDGNPGALFIGDVGWGTWEDIHVSTGGENFGWPCFEGPNTHAGYQAQSPAHSDCTTVPTQDSPEYYFNHSDANLSFPTGLQANAIVVGDVYEGTRYPSSLSNRVFYTDYTRGWVATSLVDGANNLSDQQLFGEDLGAIVDIRYDANTDFIYWVDIGQSKIFRLRHDDENAPPTAVASATPNAGYAPLQVAFTGSTSTDPDGDPLSYLWDFDNGEFAVSADTTVTFTVSGVYDVSLTVSDTAGASTQAFVQVAVGNTYPVSGILEPENGLEFQVGDYVTLEATGTDAEDPVGNLAFDWKVTQRHNSHDHPDFFYSSGPTTGFTIVDHGTPEEVNFLDIELVVTDTGGLTDTTIHLIEVARPGETDVTAFGTPTASEMSPSGAGNPDINIIADGVTPDTSATDPMLHYDTFTGIAKGEDWIGYTFPDDRFFSKLVLHEGLQTATGGWFDSVAVEVRNGGVWTPVTYPAIIKPYEYDNGVSFEGYTIIFEAVWADGIRLIGTPGGADTYVSISELRVFELPTSSFAASASSGDAPMTVSFTDNSTVGNPTAWLWSFGDGYTSQDENPSHFFSAPGAYDITLAVTGDGGTFETTKPNAVVIGSAGLLGQYYDDEDFVGSRLLRNDNEVDFDWGSGSPDVSMGADEFSVVWSGWIKPDYTELYTLYTVSDDGIRLWVDGQLVIDKWVLQAATEWSGSIPLEGRRWYPVRVEYYEHFGQASAELWWESASEAKAVIPSASLRAATLTPELTHFDPAIGLEGETITVYGQNYQDVLSVKFDGVESQFVSTLSMKKLEATVPTGAQTGPIAVETSEGSILSASDFEVDVSLAARVSDLVAIVNDGTVRFNWMLLDASTARGYAIEHRPSNDADFYELEYSSLNATSMNLDMSIEIPLTEPGVHSFRIGIDDVSGARVYSEAVEVTVELGTTHRISGPYPNPFSRETIIELTVQQQQNVKATLYDLLGRRVLVLHDGVIQSSDKTLISVDASGLTSGLYFVRVSGEEFQEDLAVTVVD